MSRSRRMETVVRVRRLQDRVAEAEVARRHGAVREHVDGIEAAVDALSRHDETSDDPLDDARGLRRRDWSIRGAFDDIAHRHQLLQIAERASDDALREWHAAHRRREAVERIAERQRLAAQVAERQQEQKELDDLVTTRHARGEGLAS
ncbi:MAG: flagellar export protein FliJ [Ilumatobacter sp.]